MVHSPEAVQALRGKVLDGNPASIGIRSKKGGEEGTVNCTNTVALVRVTVKSGNPGTPIGG